ncbi:hypothetical protein [Streptomyces sp. NPDC059378]|uniref:hypothetical protein n=1 Tax=Streptomyces sp. NPDC059378 TaxID=3346815 RepID=UPI003692F554
MWRLADATARRFPLVARFRPACLPLPERVYRLTELAATAARNNDPALASAVHNQTALLASDLGLPDLARTICHQHATACLHACPLPATSAIRALEPVVNLARLHLHAGRADEARQQLLDLHQAVTAGTAFRCDGVVVPAGLTASSEDRHEVSAWLWRVLIADATRTYTTQGRWAEALAHLQTHHGIGRRMLDGRQTAVLAALTTADTASATRLLEETVIGDFWEQTVTACLTAFCRCTAGPPVGRHLDSLTAAYLERPTEPGTIVFDIRLGLTVLDAIGTPDTPTARRIADDLHRRTTQAQDGYAAREYLAHPLIRTIATDKQAQDCQALVHACHLGTGTLPEPLGKDLAAALRTSHRVIRTSTTSNSGPRHPQPETT